MQLALRSVVGDSRQALERLASLTGQLVSASKGDTLALKRQPVDLRRVVTRALALANRLAEDKKVNIHFKPGPDPAWVEGDEEAINTVVINLVSNAVRYTPSGGDISVSTQHWGDSVALECEHSGDLFRQRYVVVPVRDVR
jgi:signal transduction histidine kinase